MAIQAGVIKLSGTIGGITFVAARGGYYARRKSCLDARRIARDPAFARTRENAAEFGRASRAGKLLRVAIAPYQQRLCDHTLMHRLTGILTRILKTDTVNPRGKRSFVEGDLSLLEGFECNAAAPLQRILGVPFNSQFSAATGQYSIGLRGFVPREVLRVPQGATHYKLSAAGVGVNFGAQVYITSVSHTEVLRLDAVAAPVRLKGVLAGEEAADCSRSTFGHIVLLLGIQFFQRVSGVDYVLEDGSALAVVKAGKVVAAKVLQEKCPVSCMRVCRNGIKERSDTAMERPDGIKNRYNIIVAPVMNMAICNDQKWLSSALGP